MEQGCDSSCWCTPGRGYHAVHGRRVQFCSTDPGSHHVGPPRFYPREQSTEGYLCADFAPCRSTFRYYISGAYILLQSVPYHIRLSPRFNAKIRILPSIFCKKTFLIFLQSLSQRLKQTKFKFTTKKLSFQRVVSRSL